MSNKWNELFPEIEYQIHSGNNLKHKFLKKALDTPQPVVPTPPPVSAAPPPPAPFQPPEPATLDVDANGPAAVNASLRKAFGIPSASVGAGAVESPKPPEAKQPPAAIQPPPSPVAAPKPPAPKPAAPAAPKAPQTFAGDYDAQGQGEGVDDVLKYMDEDAAGAPVDLQNGVQPIARSDGKEWDEEFLNYNHDEMKPQKQQLLETLAVDPNYSAIVTMGDDGTPQGLDMNNLQGISGALKQAKAEGNSPMYKELTSLVYSQQHQVQSDAQKFMQEVQTSGVWSNPNQKPIIQQKMQEYGKQIIGGSLVAQAALSDQDPAAKLQELMSGKVSGAQLQKAMQDPMFREQMQQQVTQMQNDPMQNAMSTWNGLSTPNKVALGLGIPMALFGALQMFSGDSGGMGMITMLMGLLGIAQGAGLVDMLGMSGASGAMGTDDSQGAMQQWGKDPSIPVADWAQPQTPPAAPPPGAGAAVGAASPSVAAAPQAQPGQPAPQAAAKPRGVAGLDPAQKTQLATLKVPPYSAQALASVPTIGKNVQAQLDDPNSQLWQEIKAAPEYNDPSVVLDPKKMEALTQKLAAGIQAKATAPPTGMLDVAGQLRLSQTANLNPAVYQQAAKHVANNVLGQRVKQWQGELVANPGA